MTTSLVSDIQFAKALMPIEVNVPLTITEDNDALPLKAFVPSILTLLPKVTVFNDVFPEKVAYDDE